MLRFLGHCPAVGECLRSSQTVASNARDGLYVLGPEMAKRHLPRQSAPPAAPQNSDDPDPQKP
jgi:hypothetical protein